MNITNSAFDAGLATYNYLGRSVWALVNDFGNEESTRGCLTEAKIQLFDKNSGEHWPLNSANLVNLEVKLNLSSMRSECNLDIASMAMLQSNGI